MLEGGAYESQRGSLSVCRGLAEFLLHWTSESQGDSWATSSEWVTRNRVQWGLAECRVAAAKESRSSDSIYSLHSV